MTDEQIQTLIQTAITASQNAYVPYSNYHVGAALLAKDGTIYTGCNVENAAYPCTICAERTALVKAVSEGRREFDGIVVVTRGGGSPCGMCRQMLHEFGADMRCIIADTKGAIHMDVLMSDLLPDCFTPVHLKD